jgi:hypothetical protein
VTYLRPTRGLASLNLGDLWVYRELVLFLTWRDVLVRYKQTVLGAAWAVIQPVVQMVVFTLIFSTAAGFSSEGVPYPIFNFTALLPWGLFSKAMNDAGRSLVTNRNMITKIYFPRLTIPLASVLAGMVDFGIGFIVYILIILYYNFAPIPHTPTKSPGNTHPATVHYPGIGRHSGCQLVVIRHECDLPGCRARPPIFNPDLVLPHPDCIFGFSSFGKMAGFICAEPSHECGGGFSLEPVGNQQPAMAGERNISRGCCGSPDHRLVLLPQHGTDFCR